MLGANVRAEAQDTITGPVTLGTCNAFSEELQLWAVGGDKITLDLPKYYHVFSVLGQGAYGCVVAASVVTQEGTDTVAVKKFYEPFQHAIHSRRTLRELRFLRCIQHENVVNIRSVFCSGPSREQMEDLYVVTEVMDTDLYTVIRSCPPLSPPHIMFFLYQILRGLKYIHSAGIIHRDLKPKNLLVNRNCDLRICDFGMARLAHDTGIQGMDRQMTEYVCTRWYRAPELLCCWSAYSYQVDIWSTGCIFAEMMTRRCLFKGKSTIDQLRRIEAALGIPTPEEIAKIPNAKARVYLSQQKPIAVPPLTMVLGLEPSPQALDILSSCMLKFDPDKRQLAPDLLSHPYLSELHEEADEPLSAPVPPEDFEFERRRVGASDLQEELFREILEYHPEAKAAYMRMNDYDIRKIPLKVPQEDEVEDEDPEQQLPDSDQEEEQNPSMRKPLEL